MDKLSSSFKFVFACILFVSVQELSAQDVTHSIVQPAIEVKYESYYRPHRGRQDEDDDQKKPDELNEFFDDDKSVLGEIDTVDANDEDEENEDAPRQTENTFGSWPQKSIRESRLNIFETHREAPEDRSTELLMGSTATQWNRSVGPSKTFAWAASNIVYKPMYFEDVALERYGQTRGCNRQPFYSGVHFFKSFVFLPNQMYHNHPYSCDTPLGFCRPGSYAPPTSQKISLGWK